MIQRTPEEKKGLSGNAIRVWALLLLTVGLAGQSIIENRLLGLSGLTTKQLLELMNTDSNAMIYVTVALICKIAQACATPLFSMLLVEGFLHTSNLKNYLLRVLVVAAVSEIPYNLAMSGSIIDLSSRNPAFGVLLGLLLLWFFSMYQEKGMKHTLIKLIVVVAAVVWSKMLGIEGGECIVIVTGAIWAFRKKPSMRTFAACGACALCTVFSMYYLAAPMFCLLLHMYNGQPGERSQKVNYAAYPAVLVLLAACGLFL